MQFTHKFFKQIMWRSSKGYVADELQLPPQEESLTWLSFSPIEEHFYQRQHETCVSYAREVIEGFKDDILKQKITGLSLTSYFIPYELVKRNVYVPNKELASQVVLYFCVLCRFHAI